MSKAKTAKDTVIDFFESMKYFVEGEKIIVVLPEGLLLKKSSIDDGRIRMELYIDGLTSVLFVSDVESPEDIQEILVLQAEDARHFTN